MQGEVRAGSMACSLFVAKGRRRHLIILQTSAVGLSVSFVLCRFIYSYSFLVDFAIMSTIPNITFRSLLARVTDDFG